VALTFMLVEFAILLSFGSIITLSHAEHFDGAFVENEPDCQGSSCVRRILL